MRKHSHFRFRVVVARLAVIAVLLALAFGCRSRVTTFDPPGELTVSAAVSLKDAFNEIADLNQKRTGTRIHFNYGASGALQKQIESGAPVDIFASAGAKQMDELEKLGLIIEGTRSDFARNALVLIIPARGTGPAAFADLGKPEIKRVAIGNPKTVPAGQYTMQTLTKLGLLPQIQSKLVLAEDVRQVLDYVIRDEVEAGVVYASDAASGGDKIKIVAHAVDDSHDPILYPIAIIKGSNQTAAARQFIGLVRSSEGQTILVRHGFLPLK
jgi:molybdate transport system substrate-binding protein